MLRPGSPVARPPGLPTEGLLQLATIPSPTVQSEQVDSFLVDTPVQDDRLEEIAAGSTLIVHCKEQKEDRRKSVATADCHL